MHPRTFPVLTKLRFTNQFVANLPADSNPRNETRLVKDACYSFVNPIRATNPKLVAYSADLARLLQFSNNDCSSDDFLKLFAGNVVSPESKPYATCYGGHQFGQWAGQLGDGRAITLGELPGLDNTLYSLQLKGAGKTPYSRTADGLAVLRSSLREFVCSEAMYHLRVPTTRALTLILTGDHVVRDMLYDGNPQLEPGAVVCRVSPTFVRFGNFEILAAQRNTNILGQLADFVIENHFPEIKTKDRKLRYVELFEQVVDRTALLMSEWYRVGFVHGVMNTDNMSITGLTIDYGPYGWIEDFDLEWTPNTTDASTKRYRFGQQNAVAHWNLLQLANALYPLIEDVKLLETALHQYPDIYRNYHQSMLVKKLGLTDLNQVNSEFIEELEQCLSLTETDMTLFYRCLSNPKLLSAEFDGERVSLLREAFYEPDNINESVKLSLEQWLGKLVNIVNEGQVDPIRREQSMNNVNPLYVPRNYLAQLVIDEVEKGNFDMLHEWMGVLQNPYTEQQGKANFAKKRPEWAKTRVGCSMLSCSS
ncbi:MAG: YdiU family protein [Gammaproteobacteria bacterium]|nr:YdiU family protein [Gammaproteobacteria bacterium]